MLFRSFNMALIYKSSECAFLNDVITFLELLVEKCDIDETGPTLFSLWDGVSNKLKHMLLADGMRYWRDGTWVENDIELWIDVTGEVNEYDRWIPRAVVLQGNPEHNIPGWDPEYVTGRCVFTPIVHGFVKNSSFLGRLGNWDW